MPQWRQQGSCAECIAGGGATLAMGLRVSLLLAPLNEEQGQWKNNLVYVRNQLDKADLLYWNSICPVLSVSSLVDNEAPISV